jgi:predicted double-glycine peptidase
VHGGRTLVLSFALSLGGLACGCVASLPPIARPDTHRGLSADAVLLDVPLVQQQGRYDCGLGSLSMLFAFYETPVRPALAAEFRQLAATEDGLTGADLKGFVAAHGYDSFLFRGRSGGEGATSLRHHVDRGRPLVVALSPDGESNHFVLIIGYDPEKDLVLFQDPQRGGGAYPRWQFDALWRAGENFCLLAVPASAVPSSSRPEQR